MVKCKFCLQRGLNRAFCGIAAIVSGRYSVDFARILVSVSKNMLSHAQKFYWPNFFPVSFSKDIVSIRNSGHFSFQDEGE